MGERGAGSGRGRRRAGEWEGSVCQRGTIGATERCKDLCSSRWSVCSARAVEQHTGEQLDLGGDQLFELGLGRGRLRDEGEWSVSRVRAQREGDGRTKVTEATASESGRKLPHTRWNKIVPSTAAQCVVSTVLGGGLDECSAPRTTSRSQERSTACQWAEVGRESAGGGRGAAGGAARASQGTHD